MHVYAMMVGWFGLGIFAMSVFWFGSRMFDRVRERRPGPFQVATYAVMVAAALPLIDPLHSPPGWLFTLCLCVLTADIAVFLAAHLYQMRQLRRRYNAIVADLQPGRQDRP